MVTHQTRLGVCIRTRENYLIPFSVMPRFQEANRDANEKVVALVQALADKN